MEGGGSDPYAGMAGAAAAAAAAAAEERDAKTTTLPTRFPNALSFPGAALAPPRTNPAGLEPPPAAVVEGGTRTVANVAAAAVVANICALNLKATRCA